MNVADLLETWLSEAHAASGVIVGPGISQRTAGSTEVDFFSIVRRAASPPEQDASILAFRAATDEHGDPIIDAERFDGPMEDISPESQKWMHGMG